MYFQLMDGNWVLMEECEDDIYKMDKIDSKYAWASEGDIQAGGL